MDYLNADPELAEVFMSDGLPRMEDDLVVQPRLARVLQRISENGRDGFYRGETAQALVDGLAARGNVMTLEDLAGYEATVSDPVRGTYRGFQIVSAAAPHSGATLIEIMNMIELVEIDPAVHFSESSRMIHMMSEIFRRAYADRSEYLGDPRFVSIPLAGITSKQYAIERLMDINRYKAEPRNYRDTAFGFPGKFDRDRGATAVSPGARTKSLIWDDDDDGDIGTGTTRSTAGIAAELSRSPIQRQRARKFPRSAS
jgi:gamma-glutamyltranspeptidase